MDGNDVDIIADGLNDEQRAVMGLLTRVSKSDSNTFHERDLQKRKKCWDIDVKSVLKELANYGLVHRIGRKGYWRTTKLGRMVEHRIGGEEMARRWSFPVVRK